MNRDFRIETPRGKLIRTEGGTVELKWNAGFGREYEAAFHKAQKFADSSVLRLSSPFVPFQSGLLDKSGILGTEVGSGEVVYNAPYSRYLYYGKVMVGRAPKKRTSKPLSYHGAPTRGDHWFERMKLVHRDAILTGIAERLK